MEGNSKGITDWQVLVNKPVYSSDGKQVGIVSSVQPEKLVVSYGPITPNKYLIPKSSIKNFDNGIIHINDSSEFVEGNYQFE
jgi:hypothetical protein